MSSHNVDDTPVPFFIAPEDDAWVNNSPTYRAVDAASRALPPMREQSSGYDPRCCHKTVLTRCEGCPYEEKPKVSRVVPSRREEKPWVDSSNAGDPITLMQARRSPFLPGQIIVSYTISDGRSFGTRKSPVRRPESLNDFAREVHAGNQHWWHDPATGEKIDRNMGEMLMLVVSEIAECMEGERKDLMDDHLPHRKMAEVELADAIIRIADIAGAKGYGLEDPYSAYIVALPDNKGQALLRISRVVTRVTDTTAHHMRSSRLSRAVHLIEAYAKKHGYDLWGAVAEKREYNKHRADHKPEARLAAGGKKF